MNLKEKPPLVFVEIITDDLKKRASTLKENVEKIHNLYKENKRKIIEEEIREDPLRNFMRTFAATSILLDKSEKNEDFLESLLLHTSRIDAQLRLGVILKHQIINRNSTYHTELIYQSSESYISESKVCGIALREKVISEDLAGRLNTLYGKRNRAVHRFFISNFEYFELRAINKELEEVSDEIGRILHELELEQVKLGVGMTKEKNLVLDEKTWKEIQKELHLKIDSRKTVVLIPKRSKLLPEVSDR